MKVTTTKLDFGKPEPELRKEISKRALQTFAGLNAVDELKKDQVRLTAALYAIAAEDPSRSEISDKTVKAALIKIVELAGQCYARSTELMPLSQFESFGKLEECAEYCDCCHVAAEFKSVLPDKFKELQQDICLTVYGLLSDFVILLNTVDDVYALDILNSDDAGLVREALLGDKMVSSLLAAGRMSAATMAPFEPHDANDSCDCRECQDAH